MPELQGLDPRKLGPSPTVMRGARVEKARTPGVAIMYIYIDVIEMTKTREFAQERF